ncbi:MAG: molybdopterin oxidoreductase family protein [Hyphomicrobiaceae bacterium]
MKFTNRGYMEWAHGKGFLESMDRLVMQLYCEPLQRFRLAGQGHGDVKVPETHRDRISTYFDPLPFWYEPFEGQRVDLETFPLHAVTQRPMHMYHSWGSQNAWLRQITAANRLFVSRSLGEKIGLEDDDWVWVSSHQGRVRCQIKLMEGVNPDTVWTWNAIGKRSGTWNLDRDAPEATRGFLLNHLISELLPERDGGYRFANIDPVTGQAAWYDLRVRIEKAAHEPHETSPRFEPLIPPRTRRGART